MNGPFWKDPKDELVFAWHDVRHAYAQLLNVRMDYNGIAHAKDKMDAAMDRADRAIAEMLKRAYGQ